MIQRRGFIAEVECLLVLPPCLEYRTCWTESPVPTLVEALTTTLYLMYGPERESVCVYVCVDICYVVCV